MSTYAPSEIVEELLLSIRFKPARDVWISDRLHESLRMQIAAEMKCRSLNQKKLAEAMGISPSRLTKLMQARTLNAMERIVYALDCGLSIEVVPVSEIVKESLRPSDLIHTASFAEEFPDYRVIEGTAEEEKLRKKWEAGLKGKVGREVKGKGKRIVEWKKARRVKRVSNEDFAP